MDAAFGAKGNGVADDTNAIQRAIDTHNKVFLPRGDYRLTRQLVLHKNTQLFGVSGQRSRLFADWDSGGRVAHALKTDTAADATTYLADVAIHVRGGYAGSFMGIIDWRAGKNSWTRQIAVERPWEKEVPGGDHRIVLYVGPSGGGRWYGFTDQWGQVRSHPKNRIVLIENTTQPIVFYGLDIDHGNGERLFEMVNSSNMAIMGTKTETPNFGRFANSRNILIAGLSGHSSYGPGTTGALVFENTDDVLAVNITYYPGQIDNAKGPMVIEKWGGTTYTTPGTKYTSLFRRGTFCRLCF
jgi:polygalacturonase